MAQGKDASGMNSDFGARWARAAVTSPYPRHFREQIMGVHQSSQQSVTQAERVNVCRARARTERTSLDPKSEWSYRREEGESRDRSSQAQPCPFAWTTAM